MNALTRKIVKMPTGINGFDYISYGGLPKHRSTLIAGTAGAGKTLLALQFLRNGIEQFQEGAVLVTLQERPEDMFANVRSLGWDLASHEAQGRLAVVDACAETHEYALVSGEFDLGALTARIGHAVGKVQATRLILDGTGTLFSLFRDPHLVRRELQRLVMALRQLEVTAMILVERTGDDMTARYEVEEFVADNVVILRNRLAGERRRRTAEVLKFRGSVHQKGEFSFTIDPVDGIDISPISSLASSMTAATTRISLGVPELDQMCDGGIYRDNIVLVSGATGTGKTLMVSEFIDSGIQAGERSLLFSFEEDREQLVRNAANWGVDLKAAEAGGLLKIFCEYPERRGTEDHLIHIRRAIQDFNPERVAIDSISSMEQSTNTRSFREFILGVISYLKVRRIAGMLIHSSSRVIGNTTLNDAYASTIVDVIVALRYVEVGGAVRRALTLLKMRGSQHDKGIREYDIDGDGMHIKDRLVGAEGIIGSAAPSAPQSYD